MTAASLGSSGNMPYKTKRESLIPRFETCQSFKNLFNLKVFSWSSTIFKDEFVTVQIMTVESTISVVLAGRVNEAARDANASTCAFC